MSLVVSGLLETFGTGIFSSHFVGYPGTSLVAGLLGTFETFETKTHLWDWDF